MEIDKLEILKRLIDESCSLGVVITSDRRFSSVDMKNKLEAFYKYGINVVGQLRRPNEEDYDDNRGKQILDYLSSSKEDIEKILILDDNDEGISNYFEDEFILINRYYGLDENIYLKSLKILN